MLKLTLAGFFALCAILTQQALAALWPAIQALR